MKESKTRPGRRGGTIGLKKGHLLKTIGNSML
jgi:hypothetical protein